MAEELSKLIHPPWRLYRLLEIHQVGTTANIQILCNNISDELTADRLRAELRVVLETSEIKEIVLDLGNMQEASASGFRVFDFLCQQLQQRGGKPKLCNVNDSIREVLLKNRLDSLCELVPNAPRLPRPVPRRIVRHYIPEEVLSAGDRHMTVAAHRERSNQRLAVKLMPVLSGEQEEQCLTQMREYEKLRHPALVGIHDFGIEDGYFFLAADLLSCPSLATWLAGRRPTWQEAAMIIARVAEALGHMHSLGVYHGDVRPFTIYVNEDLAPLLVLPEPSALKSGIAGTPVYMAPEQLEGQRLNGQSDIYSLGVILYEMLCKRLPYNADTTITIWEMLRRVRHEEPIPPRQYAPAIPAQLEDICLKAMAKRVNDRYLTADRFKAALDHYVVK